MAPRDADLPFLDCTIAPALRRPALQSARAGKAAQGVQAAKSAGRKNVPQRTAVRRERGRGPLVCGHRGFLRDTRADMLWRAQKRRRPIEAQPCPAVHSWERRAGGNNAAVCACLGRMERVRAATGCRLQQRGSSEGDGVAAAAELALSGRCAALRAGRHCWESWRCAGGNPCELHLRKGVPANAARLRHSQQETSTAAQQPVFQRHRSAEPVAGVPLPSFSC